MLTAAQFDKVYLPLTDIYEEYNSSVVNDIARRLASLDMSPTAAWQMQRILESGAVYSETIKKIAMLTGKSEAELRRQFEAAGVKSLEFDDSIYKAAGLKPPPLNLSPAVINVLLAGLKRTNNTMHNLTGTSAMSAQSTFTTAADLAYSQVAGGTFSYDAAIRNAIVSVAKQGISVVEYATGHKDKIDVAMRRAVLTGVTQTTAQMQWTRADQMGQDLVQVSAHIGARPEHAVWQGKIYSRNGSHPKYPDFVSSTGYGTGAGLCGWNCRHSFYPYFEGISVDIYNKAMLKEMNNATVEYNGAKISAYEASQIQRSIERKIRDAKRVAGALAAAKLSNDAEILSLKLLQAQMRDFIRQTNMLRQSARERV